MGLENPLHLLMLALIAMLVFGARRLPEVGRSLGEGMRGFRDSLHGEGAQPPAALPPGAADGTRPA
jgi:sec-independent protein translocase protein TatA